MPFPFDPHERRKKAVGRDGSWIGRFSCIPSYLILLQSLPDKEEKTDGQKKERRPHM